MTFGKRIPVMTAATGILLMLVVACSRNPFPVWSSFQHVGTDGWDTMETLDFSPDVASLSVSNGVRPAIVIRHDRRLPFQTLRLQVEQSDSTGVLSTDTVTMRLADSSGRWLGRKTNALTETIDTLPVSLRLTPGFTISLTPAVKTEVIPGIVNVGIILIDPRRERRDVRTDIPGIKDLKL